MIRKRANSRMQKKLNDFGQKYGNQKHNKKAEWNAELEGLEEDLKAEIYKDLINLLKTTLIKISNWKTAGHDGIHSFWFKKFPSIPDRLALEMNRCLRGAHIPELIQNDPNKGTASNNYRPIT